MRRGRRALGALGVAAEAGHETGEGERSHAVWRVTDKVVVVIATVVNSELGSVSVTVCDSAWHASYGRYGPGRTSSRRKLARSPPYALLHSSRPLSESIYPYAGCFGHQRGARWQDAATTAPRQCCTSQRPPTSSAHTARVSLSNATLVLAELLPWCVPTCPERCIPAHLPPQTTPIIEDRPHVRQEQCRCHCQSVITP